MKTYFIIKHLPAGFDRVTTSGKTHQFIDEKRGALNHRLHGLEGFFATENDNFEPLP